MDFQLCVSRQTKDKITYLWYNICMYKQYESTVLWDIDKNKVDTLSKEFVVQRVLSYGSISLIIGLIKEYGVDFVQGVFLKMKPTAISKKKYNYFKNYLFV